MLETVNDPEAWGPATVSARASGCSPHSGLGMVDEVAEEDA
jgi:hypothetical protein